MKEQFALYERAICSFKEWALLFFEEKTENWTYKFISLFGHAFIKNKRMQITLFKKATRVNQSCCSFK